MYKVVDTQKQEVLFTGTYDECTAYKLKNRNCFAKIHPVGGLRVQIPVNWNSRIAVANDRSVI